jgi:hypothetical protein
MSAKMELRWLKEDDYQGASQKFIRFCKEDIFQQAASDPNFDFEIYVSSIRLILEKLDQLKEQQIRGVL